MICSLQNDNNQDDEGEVFFWDPPSAKNRNSKNQNHVRQLQEQLVQATMKIRDLEAEVKRIQKVKYSMHTNFIFLLKFLSVLANICQIQLKKLNFSKILFNNGKNCNIGANKSALIRKVLKNSQKKI